MFITILDKFSEKFKSESKIPLQKDSLDSNNNSNNSNNNSSKSSNNINNNNHIKNLLNLEEKSTYEVEESNNNITLVNLLSKKDQSGNTPMLFAAFRGNITVMEKMIDLGVRYDCRNNAGLNIIHMAAQSDCPNVIVYFKEKYNFDLFQNDELNNNSLHWACSSGSKSALDYILPYINKENNNERIVNCVNSQGQTALHITILTTGSISTIKKLIKKNIDINIKDNNGLTALDLVKEEEKYKNMEKTIIEYSYKNCLGLNYHINDKRNKYIKFISFNILSVFIIFTILFLFFPFLKSQNCNLPFIEYFCYFSTLIFIILYSYIIFSDPGVIEKNGEPWINIIKSGKNLNKMCPYCRVEQGKFSKHCFLCDKCIEVFDHHCHWINNCVGHLNKPYFLGFIISLLITLVIDSFVSFNVLFVPTDGKSDIFGMDNNIGKSIYSFIVMILCLFFVFPVGYLLYMQFANKDTTQKEVQTYLKEVSELKEDKGNDDNDKTEKLL